MISGITGDGNSSDTFGDGYGADWVMGNGWGCGFTFGATGDGHGSDYTYVSFNGLEPDEGDGSGGCPDGEENSSPF